MSSLIFRFHFSQPMVRLFTNAQLVMAIGGIFIVPTVAPSPASK